jgi:murein DD-endopeptidase MepM/ murein hydrolase activator NlpD
MMKLYKSILKCFLLGGVFFASPNSFGKAASKPLDSVETCIALRKKDTNYRFFSKYKVDSVFLSLTDVLGKLSLIPFDSEGANQINYHNDFFYYVLQKPDEKYTFKDSKGICIYVSEKKDGITIPLTYDQVSKYCADLCKLENETCSYVNSPIYEILNAPQCFLIQNNSGLFINDSRAYNFELSNFYQGACQKIWPIESIANICDLYKVKDPSAKFINKTEAVSSEYEILNLSGFMVDSETQACIVKKATTNQTYLASYSSPSQMIDTNVQTLFAKAGISASTSGINYNELPLGLPIYTKIQTSGFEWRKLTPTSRTVFHDAVDYQLEENNLVHATQDGVVEKIQRRDSVYGNSIRLKHNYGFSTFYAHLNKLYVSEGQSVKYGEVIGLSGNTGLSTGAHLHYGISYNNTPFNPAPFVDAKNNGFR